MSKHVDKISAKDEIEKKVSTEKKVIYLSYIRLTDRVAKTWFINDLISKKINVEFWDLISFMREPHNEINELNPDYLSHIYSLKELKHRIKQESRISTVFVILFPYNNKTFKVHRLLSKYKVKKVYIDWGAMPVYGEASNLNLMKKILKQRSIIIKILTDKLSRTFLRLYQISPCFEKFDIVFTSGDIVEKNRVDSKKISPLAFGDYSEFLIHSKIQNEQKRKTAVFLDINLPYQSDLHLVSLPSIDPTKYYHELHSFFSKLEKEFDLEVVVAAHPKTSENSRDFYNRSINRMNTAQMVRDAEFVISHQSTSISYAVLNYKPLLFIYTNEMKLLYKNSVVAEIENLAKYFDVDPINISEDFISQKNPIGKVLKHQYDKYIENFLASKESQGVEPKEAFHYALINLIEDRNDAR